MFSSPWWLPGGHLQTIYASLRPPPRVPLERSRWQTADGDFVDVDFAGDAKAPGTSRFSMASRAAPTATTRASRPMPCLGWRVAIPHWRGCSGEPNLRPRAYHSGDSEEVNWLIEKIQPDCAVGMSLGGNALLKWLGERERQRHEFDAQRRCQRPSTYPPRARRSTAG